MSDPRKEDSVFPSRFRKRPIEVEAMRWDGSEESQSKIVTWAQPHASGWFDSAYYIAIQTLHGETRLNPGEWVVKGPGGDFWPVQAEIFEQSYQPDVDRLRLVRDGTISSLHMTEIDFRTLDYQTWLTIKADTDAEAEAIASALEVAFGDETGA